MDAYGTGYLRIPRVCAWFHDTEICFGTCSWLALALCMQSTSTCEFMLLTNKPRSYYASESLAKPDDVLWGRKKVNTFLRYLPFADRPVLWE
jgi:hypothetical protein